MILELLCQGHGVTKVVRFVGTTRTVVRRVCNRGDAERALQHKPNLVRMPELLHQVAQAVKKQPSTIISALVCKFNTSRLVMNKLVKQDGMRSYKRPQAHKVSAGAKVCQVQRAKALRSKIKHGQAGKMPVFTDKKYFTLAQYSNRQNDQVIWRKGELDQAPDELFHVRQVQRPAGVMFFSAVASNGEVAPPIFVEKGPQINATSYVKLLCHHIKPWIDRTFVPRSFVWQQDSASAHTAQKAQDFLGETGWTFWS